MRPHRAALLLTLAASAFGFTGLSAASMPSEQEILSIGRNFLTETIRTADPDNRFDHIVPPLTELIEVSVTADSVRMVFNNRLGFRPWFPDSAAEITEALQSLLPSDAPPVEIVIRYGTGASARDYSFDSHITSPEGIASRSNERPRLSHPVVARVDRAVSAPQRGLFGSNIVVGPSHGWTWHQENRWQFQRARLFTVVEDLFPMAYINPFLIPMLENAGATVFSVRERDHQIAEVIVDNDGMDPRSSFRTLGTFISGQSPGWRGGIPAAVLPQDEPFTKGTTLRAEILPNMTSEAIYHPYIPRTGDYAVYISWPQAADQSPATMVKVRHQGGETRFTVNQQVAGSTWVYLGHFYFQQDAPEERASVVITTDESETLGATSPTFIAVDAVRFGGGMGNAAPAGLISGKARYTEAARYFLQYAGAPRSVFLQDSINPHFGPDYWRDIIARAEWTNFLNGAPSGPNGDRDNPGLGVPIDLYLSFHTDAGVDPEGLFGTLSLYTILDDEGSDVFPDGRSRLLNRDLTALMQEEIVRTGRLSYTSTWERRALQDRNLGEIRRPNVPSTLLELLSHQNFNDMKYGLDPRFQHDMARAIYKSIARFIAFQEGREPVIQPLPVTHLSALNAGQGQVTVSWRPQPDPLEPSAFPTDYIVYTSRDGLSFDNGEFTTQMTHTIFGVADGEERFFRVVAANDGGTSLPSRLVGVRRADTSKTVLIVDGFDRVSGPAILETDSARGFDRNRDTGIGYLYNFQLVGNQYDFNPQSEWQNDLEATGWGASNSDLEDQPELGNQFNHVIGIGEAIAPLGLGYESMTADAFAADDTRLAYGAIIWIAGRQRTVDPPIGMDNQGSPDRMVAAFPVLTDAHISRIEQYLDDQGKFLISGAHIGEDLTTSSMGTSRTRAFAQQILGIGEATRSESTINSIAVAPEAPLALQDVPVMRFGSDLDNPINMLRPVLRVPAFEAFTPLNQEFRVGLVYPDTGEAASLSTRGTTVVGFPIETVVPVSDRITLIRALLREMGVDLGED